MLVAIVLLHMEVLTSILSFENEKNKLGECLDPEILIKIIFLKDSKI